MIIQGSNLGAATIHELSVWFGASHDALVQIPFKSVKPVSFQEVIFRLPPGQGQNLSVQVSLGRQQSPVYTGFSYASPVAATVLYWNGSVDALPTPFFYMMRGRNFGRCCYQQAVRGVADGTCHCRGDLLSVRVYPTGSYYNTFGDKSCLPLPGYRNATFETR